MVVSRGKDIEIQDVSNQSKRDMNIIQVAPGVQKIDSQPGYRKIVPSFSH